MLEKTPKVPELIEPEEDTCPTVLGLYQGERNDSLERHGFGWALFPNGDQFEGIYKHGLPCGIGLYVFKNGARYLGEWVKGLKAGNGKFYYPDGTTYDGDWKRNLQHGHGIYTYTNGDNYDGAWYRGQKHGVGVYTIKETGVKYIGTWREGIRDGPCEIVYNNQCVYHGYWRDNGPLGRGVFNFDCKYMAQGYMYEDGWRCQEISKYDYSKLPSEPIPLPTIESMQSVCDVDSVPQIEPAIGAIGEDEEEGEMEEDDDV